MSSETQLCLTIAFFVQINWPATKTYWTELLFCKLELGLLVSISNSSKMTHYAMLKKVIDWTFLGIFGCSHQLIPGIAIEYLTLSMLLTWIFLEMLIFVLSFVLVRVICINGVTCGTLQKQLFSEKISLKLQINESIPVNPRASINKNLH